VTDAFGLPKGTAGHRDGAAQDNSVAMNAAAKNLLHKAVAALDIGQTDTALAYVRRAERLPYDDNGAASPLSLAAHMYALESVLDVFEAGDGVWIDAAGVLLDPMKTWTPLAMADFRHALTVVRDEYGVAPADSRELSSLIAGRQVATIRDMQELAGEELCAVVMDLLDILIEYSHEAEAILGERDPDDG